MSRRPKSAPPQIVRPNPDPVEHLKLLESMCPSIRVRAKAAERNVTLAIGALEPIKRALESTGRFPDYAAVFTEDVICAAVDALNQAHEEVHWIWNGADAAALDAKAPDDDQGDELDEARAAAKEVA
jgi:hypothetical protein